VHYCVKNDSPGYQNTFSGVRKTLPKLFDQYQLDGRTLGARRMDDTWIERTSQAIFAATPERAAEIAAGALAEGIAPLDLGEAIALAANQLILRDHGRREREVQPNKPPGSVHGDSIGVHACDSANAWRNLARVSQPRHTIATLILAAYQVAFDR